MAHAPIAVVTANDHGAWILISNAFGLTVVLITLIIRLYIRVRVSPPFGTDDWVFAAATALTVVQAGIVFAQVDVGYGRSIDLLDEASKIGVQQLEYAAEVLFTAALYTSKCCVVLFFKRISPARGTAIFAFAMLGMCLVFAAASILAVAIRCDVSQPWIVYGVSCDGLLARWQAAIALDMASEVALFAMSLHLVWDLQTSITRKSKVVFAFALRLFVILIAGFRLHRIQKQLQSPDPTLLGANTAVITQVELFYSVVAATIPCLRPFLGAFNTAYGAMGGDTIMHGSHIGNTTRAKDSKASHSSFALQSLDSARRKAGGNEKMKDISASRELQNDSTGILRPENVANRFTAGHGKTFRPGDDANSIGSDESTRGMIIRKDVTFHIDSESLRNPSNSETRPIERTADR